MRSGSVIPVDGVVVSGDAAVNQATMTGEPLPVHRTVGGSVFAGTVVEDGEIDIRPTALGDASRLSQIVSFIQNSEAAKAGIQAKLNASPTPSSPTTSCSPVSSSSLRVISPVRLPY